MKLHDLIKTNEDYHLIAGAESVSSSRALLKVIKERRNQIRRQNEDNPKRSSENLKEDIVYKMGFLAGLNFVLDLPEKVREHLKNLPEGD